MRIGTQQGVRVKEKSLSHGKKITFTWKELQNDNPKVLRKNILTLGISF
jgi:hypothetical protein